MQYNWMMYYVLWQQQQTAAKKAQQEKEQAEQEAKEAQERERQALEEKKQAEEEARKAQEQLGQENTQVESSPTTEPEVEQDTPKQPVSTEADTERTERTEAEKTETPKVTTIATKPTYAPRATDCELLYEIGTPEFATCDYARAQNAQANSNIAMMLMFCLAAGIGIAALIVHHVDRSVDEKYRGGGYYLS